MVVLKSIIMAIINKNKSYKWTFENIGGSTRVKITSGKDIAHLAELDPKMWTVLACPIKGLEIDEKSLAYIDVNKDGKIHIDDITATAKWITTAIKDNELLLKGESAIGLEQFNTENEIGEKLYKSAKQILENLGKGESGEISIADTTDGVAIFANTRFNGDGVITEATAEDEKEKGAIAAAVATVGNTPDRNGTAGINADLITAFYTALKDYAAWYDSAVAAPWGDNTDKAIELYNALDSKVKDFFMRSKLAAFSPDNTANLDVKSSQIDAISAENLTGKMAEIATYPIARVTGKAEIDLSEPINPAWAPQFNTLKSIAISPKKRILTEDDWSAIGGEFAAYLAWKNAKAGAAVESLGIDKIKELIGDNCEEALKSLVAQDLALKEEADNIDNVDKFLHIYRDFYRLLKNFVTFQDFYNPKKEVKAIFQSGTLIIDQRACNFCMNVADMGKHGTSAPASGMYLLYCDCTSKEQPGKLQIVAAMTTGETGSLMVGKNAIYYDNKGRYWDAVVTKIVENPISIGEAFWSPYRRMAKSVENLINKQAAEKDAKLMANANKQINAAPAATAAPAAAGATQPAAAPPFDIAKFAGIFAAIGMAVGMIGSALVSLAKGFGELAWWQAILAVAGILLIVSGPSMVMAWMKLRRRNFAPLLNANGWAINASANISIPFGTTLTDMAKFPKIKLKDPYAKKGMATWKKIVITVIVIAAAAILISRCDGSSETKVNVEIKSEAIV